MVRSIVVGMAVAVLAVGCSSSSAAPTTGTAGACFDGTYSVTFATQSGNCGNLDVATTYEFQQASDGQFHANIPAGATPSPGTFDESTCHAQYGYSVPGAGACAGQSQVVSDDFRFTSTGFTGTLSITGCNDPGDGGAAQSCSGVYNVTGVRK